MGYNFSANSLLNRDTKLIINNYYDYLVLLFWSTLYQLLHTCEDNNVIQPTIFVEDNSEHFNQCVVCLYCFDQIAEDHRIPFWLHSLFKI